jgi:hypothetical protein
MLWRIVQEFGGRNAIVVDGMMASDVRSAMMMDDFMFGCLGRLRIELTFVIAAMMIGHTV